MEDLKFTVIIPTRERSDVLKSAIKTLISQDYENLEIIISDNFSCDETKSVVKSFSSEKIRYINTGERVGMSQNWEFALNHVTEGWVTIIGDDDGLLPGSLIKVAEIIRLTGTQAIRSSACGYHWPNENNDYCGRLGVPLGLGWEKRNSSKWLARVMMGKSDCTHLPMLYNGGFVACEVLNTIKEKSGAFFRSMVPDVYMAIAISSTIPYYVYSFEPLAISGASKHSGGGSGFSTKKKNKDSPCVKFFREPNIPFHDALPLAKSGNPVLSIQAIVYESYLQSKCLRELSEFEDHQKQLELILASSAHLKNLVVEWADIFANKHGLDIEMAQSNAKQLELRSKLFKWTERVNTIISTYSVGDSQCPLRDVYEASVAAATVRAIAPSRLNNFFRIVRREMARSRGAVI